MPHQRKEMSALSDKTYVCPTHSHFVSICETCVAANFNRMRLESAPLREMNAERTARMEQEGITQQDIAESRSPRQGEYEPVALREPERDEGESELRPCPFCGGEARWGQSDDEGHFIECSKCQASTNLTYYLKDDASQNVMERWNRRAESQSLREQPKPKCPDCNSVGMSHCSDPEYCGGVYWPDHVYRDLQQKLAMAGEVIGELVKALERIANDFETDFVLDGQVVDEPYHMHRRAWEIARAALTRAEEFRKGIGR